MINNRKIGFPVVYVKTDFIAPLRYGDTIHATIAIERVGTSSVTWNYRLHNQDGTLLWASTQVTVCVDMDSLESQPVPDDLRQGLLNHLMEVEQ
jgi:YbgC/YbaW family acyl-CoA thioester hydrolase